MTQASKPSSLRRFVAVITHPVLALVLVPFFIFLWGTMPHTPRDGWTWVKVPFVPKSGFLGGIADPAVVGPVDMYVRLMPEGEQVVPSSEWVKVLLASPDTRQARGPDAAFNVALYRRRTGLWIIDTLRESQRCTWYLGAGSVEVPTEKRREYLLAGAARLDTKGAEWAPYPDIARAMRRSADNLPDVVTVDPVKRAANIAISVLFPIAIASCFRMAMAGRRRWMAWRNPDRTRCRGCGYSLAGLLDNRCPECGQATQST